MKTILIMLRADRKKPKSVPTENESVAGLQTTDTHSNTQSEKVMPKNQISKTNVNTKTKVQKYYLKHKKANKMMTDKNQT
jgi:hypothetical protein